MITTFSRPGAGPDAGHSTHAAAPWWGRQAMEDPSAFEHISALRAEVGALREVISALEQRLDRVERRSAAPGDNVVDMDTPRSNRATMNPLAEDNQDDSYGSTAIRQKTASLLHQVRGTYEAMRARPANLHQATALLCLDPDIEQPTKFKYIITSFVVVVAQLLTCRSISGGAKYPSCATSADCPSGYACSTLSSE